MTSSRQLAAIMFTDIVGYTALMQASEADGKLKAKHYRKILSEQVAEHGGTIIQNYGDGSLTIFSSAVEAVECAMAIQHILKEEPVVPLRIGIHLGDIVIDGEDFYGDGINVAARIESMGVEGANTPRCSLTDRLIRGLAADITDRLHAIQRVHTITYDPPHTVAV